MYSCHRSARSVTFSRLSDTPYWQAMPVKAPQPAAIHLSAGGNMEQFTPTQIDALSALVAPDRFSTGQSNRELHIKDISPHRGKLPAGIIWPVTTEEVSAILGLHLRRKAFPSRPGAPVPAPKATHCPSRVDW
jgi:hypothetical protein